MNASQIHAALTNGIRGDFWLYLKTEILEGMQERLEYELKTMSLEARDIQKFAEVRAQYRFLKNFIELVEGQAEVSALWVQEEAEEAAEKAAE